MNVMQALREAFGASSVKVDLSSIGGDENEQSPAYRYEVQPLELVLDENSRVFVSCGHSKVIARMRAASPSANFTFYLVWDDNDARAWQLRRRKYEALMAERRVDEIDWVDYYKPCPDARLRVVAA